jgi:MFS family permease
MKKNERGIPMSENDSASMKTSPDRSGEIDFLASQVEQKRNECRNAADDPALRKEKKKELAIAQRHLSERKELRKWEREKARPKPKTYLWFLLMILSLVYIVDEVSTNTPGALQSNLIFDFFHTTDINTENYGKGLDGFGLLSTITIFLMIISCFYKPLADRYGRKIFLFINTLGMGLAMAICFASSYTNQFMFYAAGFIILRWFVTPDEQVVYIFECVDKKKRATAYSLIKGLAEFSLFFIPLFRKLFLTGDDVSSWRWVFFIPAVACFAVSFLVLLLARETDPFLDRRISYLRMSDEERESLRKAKSDTTKKSGLIAGLFYAMKDKQLRNLFFATLLYTLARCVTDYYEPILQNIGSFSSGMTSEQVSDAVTSAEFLLPLGAGIVTILFGFVSDKLGRKPVSIGLLASALLFFLLFIFSVRNVWHPYVIGTFLGFFLASYWNTGDTYLMMGGESSPTNLRTSIMSAQTAFYGAGQGLSSLLWLLFTHLLRPYIAMDWYLLCVAVPCFTLSLLLLMFGVRETKGVSIKSLDKNEENLNSDHE